MNRRSMLQLIAALPAISFLSREAKAGAVPDYYTLPVSNRERYEIWRSEHPDVGISSKGWMGRHENLRKVIADPQGWIHVYDIWLNTTSLSWVGAPSYQDVVRTSYPYPKVSDAHLQALSWQLDIGYALYAQQARKAIQDRLSELLTTFCQLVPYDYSRCNKKP